MATYFGQQSGDLIDTPSEAVTMWCETAYTCPGSGSQNIQELSVSCYQVGAANIRLGVYNSTGTTLIAEGTSEVAVAANGGAPAWQGHMTQASVKAAGGSSPGVLTGGASYRLAISQDAANNLKYNLLTTGAAGLFSGKFTDYTGGMPSALPVPDFQPSDAEPSIRCGVDPASVGGKPYYAYAQQQ